MRALSEKEWMAQQLVYEYDILGITATLGPDYIDLDPPENVPASVAIATVACMAEVRAILEARRN